MNFAFIAIQSTKRSVRSETLREKFTFGALAAAGGGVSVTWGWMRSAAAESE
jgi:hypothetical protein